MAYTTIDEVVMNAVKISLEKNLKLFFGRKAAIRKKQYVTYAGLEVYTLLKW
jgi:hypothetical protein